MKWYNLKLIHPNQNYIKDFFLKIPIVTKLLNIENTRWKCAYNWITICTTFFCLISLYLILLCQVLKLTKPRIYSLTLKTLRNFSSSDYKSVVILFCLKVKPYVIEKKLSTNYQKEKETLKQMK